jgi:hypothetical protein
MGHHTPIRFFLRDLGYERNLLCRLIAVETDHRKLATGRRLGSSATAVVATSSGASAPRVAPAVVAQAGAPPPSIELVREVLARRIDGARSVAMVARVWAKIHMG